MPRKKFDLSLLPPAPDLQFEQEFWDAGVLLVAGIDEAGRGALAGPVVAGAVVLPNRTDLTVVLNGVKDSKQMTAKARQKWFEVIQEVAVAAEVGLASAAEIDEIGILPATRLAALRALLETDRKPEHLLLDYLSIPAAGLPETTLVKGDCRSLSIAAASIMAKVTRDTLMVRLEDEYPGYGFAAHKGYGTAGHRAAIKKLGPCPVHRMSFAPMREDPQIKLF